MLVFFFYYIFFNNLRENQYLDKKKKKYVLGIIYLRIFSLFHIRRRRRHGPILPFSRYRRIIVNIQIMYRDAVVAIVRGATIK